MVSLGGMGGALSTPPQLTQKTTEQVSSKGSNTPSIGTPAPPSSRIQGREEGKERGGKGPCKPLSGHFAIKSRTLPLVKIEPVLQDDEQGEGENRESGKLSRKRRAEVPKTKRVFFQYEESPKIINKKGNAHQIISQHTGRILLTSALFQQHSRTSSLSRIIPCIACRSSTHFYQ